MESISSRKRFIELLSEFIAEYPQYSIGQVMSLIQADDILFHLTDDALYLRLQEFRQHLVTSQKALTLV